MSSGLCDGHVCGCSVHDFLGECEIGDAWVAVTLNLDGNGLTFRTDQGRFQSPQAQIVGDTRHEESEYLGDGNWNNQQIPTLEAFDLRKICDPVTQRLDLLGYCGPAYDHGFGDGIPRGDCLWYDDTNLTCVDDHDRQVGCVCDTKDNKTISCQNRNAITGI